MDYEAKYNSLLKETVRGVKLRMNFLSYGSNVGDYISMQQERIFDLKAQARNNGSMINTRRNMNLSSKLLKLGVQNDSKLLRGIIRF